MVQQRRQRKRPEAKQTVHVSFMAITSRGGPDETSRGSGRHMDLRMAAASGCSGYHRLRATRQRGRPSAAVGLGVIVKDSFRWDETMRRSTGTKLPMDLATRGSGAVGHRYSNAAGTSLGFGLRRSHGDVGLPAPGRGS